MARNSHFLWPDARFKFSSLFASAAVETVERELAGIYSNSVPVLFSSARACIPAVLELMDLHRSSLVWVPPYSSQCVLEAVSRIATPTPVLAENSAAIVFHQWGYIHRIAASFCIEDAADSFLLPGPIVFPNQGKFQIVSLPKIFGCLGGGVVFCQSGEDADQLRRIRQSRRGSRNLQLLLKIAGGRSAAARRYWGGAESLSGQPPAILCAAIISSLKNLEAMITEHKKKLSLVREFAPSWLRFPEDRLPCVVPVDAELLRDRKIIFNCMPILPLHFNRTQDASNVQLVKTIPVPIHKDTSIEWLEQVKGYLN
ncbi:MAG: putative PLP-dependent aminotransferase [Chitinophagaceae bacterium]|nr:putative PLP-dependent aminotransferase [Chitinophagaceae bacterium]